MMNPMHYYHTPVKPTSTRASCPVCHETVYSRAGIHPQCAVIQSDPPKLRSKKQPAGALVDQPSNATDQPGADIVGESAIVESTSAAKQPIVATTADGGRAGHTQLGRGKGTWARFIK
jgi:hypothetical protein